MTYYVSSGTLNSTNSAQLIINGDDDDDDDDVSDPNTASAVTPDAVHDMMAYAQLTEAGATGLRGANAVKPVELE